MGAFDKENSSPALNGIDGHLHLTEARLARHITPLKGDLSLKRVEALLPPPGATSANSCGKSDSLFSERIEFGSFYP